uniref:indole-3-pyruvate monooxygenase n=1 Tax=Arundo donax TaxID=35708 RepID=A0A0A9GYF4_ARUDO
MEAVDLATGEAERYAARFLVVAAGENDEKFVPEVPGMEGFPGKVVHAAEYRSPEGMRGKAVLVVGCGNSGMEIAYDLASAGAVTSIVVLGEHTRVARVTWRDRMHANSVNSTACMSTSSIEDAKARCPYGRWITCWMVPMSRFSWYMHG